VELRRLEPLTFSLRMHRVHPVGREHRVMTCMLQRRRHLGCNLGHTWGTRWRLSSSWRPTPKHALVGTRAPISHESLWAGRFGLPARHRSGATTAEPTRSRLCGSVRWSGYLRPSGPAAFVAVLIWSPFSVEGITMPGCGSVIVDRARGGLRHVCAALPTDLTPMHLLAGDPNFAGQTRGGNRRGSRGPAGSVLRQRPLSQVTAPELVRSFG
jgi:hypothetical protein